MSVIGPMKKFDPLPIPFQSVPIETESEKIGTRLIGISIGVTRYLDAFPYLLLLAKRKIKPRFSLGVLALACDPIKNQHLVISRLKKYS